MGNKNQAGRIGVYLYIKMSHFIGTIEAHLPYFSTERNIL